MEGEADITALRARRSAHESRQCAHCARERGRVDGRGELVEMFQPVGRRRAGDEGISLTPADGSATPSLPTESGEKREV